MFYFNTKTQHFITYFIPFTQLLLLQYKFNFVPFNYLNKTNALNFFGKKFKIESFEFSDKY